MSGVGGGQSAEIDGVDQVPADGTLVRLKRGMPGTYEGQPATVRHRHPSSGHSNFPRLVWLECEVIWSHGTADGFWASRGEYVVPPIHACPPEGSGVMPCCGKTPFEVPSIDRMTSTEEVTCRG